METVWVVNDRRKPQVVRAFTNEKAAKRYLKSSCTPDLELVRDLGFAMHLRTIEKLPNGAHAIAMEAKEVKLES